MLKLYPMCNPAPVRRPCWLIAGATTAMVLTMVLTACGGGGSAAAPGAAATVPEQVGAETAAVDPASTSPGGQSLTKALGDDPELAAVVEEQFGANLSEVPEACVVGTLYVGALITEWSPASDAATKAYAQDLRDRLTPLAPEQLADEFSRVNGAARARDAVASSRSDDQLAFESLDETMQGLRTAMAEVEDDLDAIMQWAIRECPEP